MQINAGETVALKFERDDGAARYYSITESTSDIYPTFKSPDGTVQKSWGVPEIALFEQVITFAEGGEVTVERIDPDEIPEKNDDETEGDR